MDCPCRMWLEKIYPKLVPPPDAALQRIFDQGKSVDVKAQELFPGGVTVQGFNFDGYENTKRAMASGADVLYQPTIVADGLSCRADILVRSGNGWDLHEVKMSTKIDEENYCDATFQTLCFERAGIKINKIFLTYINNKYVRQGEIDVKQLFIDEDISHEVAARRSSIAELIPKAKEVFNWGTALKPEYFIGCKDPRTCEWVKIWTDTLPEDERATLLENCAALPTKKLPSFHVDREGIRKELAGLQYPLYFFDYETHSSALPSFDGYRPYQQIPFQFSVYVIDEPGATPRIDDFLMKTFEDPVPQLLGAFKSVMGTEGSVISWYAKFEKSRNQEMAELHPEYAELLNNVNERTYDLMDIFKNGLYVDPACGGSNSLKAVMPVLVPELSYKTLAIQEGGTASASWSIVTNPKLPEAQRVKLYQDMIEYCRLDVYAMVRILDVLRGISAQQVVA
ncbi:MAG: DUF2779 domain-containing protein [bacterium]|nr:DUF2779 domain-containing protein [bacterium]